MSNEVISLHATALLLGERGVIISGESGAGKSSLALDLMAQARGRGWFACLIADDRVNLSAHHGRLIAHAPRLHAGMIEQRGLGLLSIAHEPAAQMSLVIALSAQPPRLPTQDEARCVLAGICMPRLHASSRCVLLLDMVLARAGVKSPGLPCQALALN